MTSDLSSGTIDNVKESFQWIKAGNVSLRNEQNEALACIDSHRREHIMAERRMSDTGRRVVNHWWMEFGQEWIDWSNSQNSTRMCLCFSKAASKLSVVSTRTFSSSAMSTSQRARPKMLTRSNKEYFMMTTFSEIIHRDSAKRSRCLETSTWQRAMRWLRMRFKGRLAGVWQSDWLVGLNVIDLIMHRTTWIMSLNRILLHHSSMHLSYSLSEVCFQFWHRHFLVSEA